MPEDQRSYRKTRGSATRCLATLLALGSLAHAADQPQVAPTDLPRVPATEPGQATTTFEVKPGFKAELVAAEPQVVDPIALCFDENSRLFVVEMRDYSERRDERLGRIRLLVDSDEDGRMDTSTIFAEGLPWPTALIWANGGLFVGSTPDLFFFKDTDGDGKADEKKLIYTGFGTDATRLNVQQLVNSFNWSLDNRIHGATGANGGSIKSIANPDHPTVHLRSHDFSFDPKTLELRPESGGGQYGMSFDSAGRKFVCSNSSHLRQVMYEYRYAADSSFPFAPPAVDIPVDGPAAAVFRRSPDEPWRVIRTRWRVSGLVPGPIEGGGRASGYFTGATGATIYRGTALGSDFNGNAFVADCGSNLIHRKQLRPNGVPFLAERPEDEQNSEFLASTDNWFRPVQFANAPDGALYFADMYREVIEHPWSIPPNLKQHIDLNSGNDRGRIYRIVPTDFKQPKLPKLGSASTAELVATLAHPNGWHRETASRLLYERQDQSAVSPLRKLANHSSPLARMHALYALSGLNALTPADLVAALKDGHETVRRHAIRLSETVTKDGHLPAALWNALRSLADDPSLEVHYQLGWTLGTIKNEEKWSTVSQLLRSSDDKWLRAAAFASASRSPAKVWTELPEDQQLKNMGQELLSMAGKANNVAEIKLVSERLNDLDPGALVTALAALTSTKLPEGLGDSLLQRGVEQSIAKVKAEKTPLPLKLSAISLLKFSNSEEADSLLKSQFRPDISPDIQIAALNALTHGNDDSWINPVLASWNSLTPGARGRSFELLFSKQSRTKQLLKTVEAGQFRASEIPVSEAIRLRAHKDPEIARLAENLVAPAEDRSLDELIERYQVSLSTQGDTELGAKLFDERCASCHRYQNRGTPIGPDLESVRQAGRRTALLNIIEPNKEVAPRFLAYEVETTDGESYTGIIVQDTPALITLQMPNSPARHIERSKIKTIRSSGKSLMPDGLHAGMTQADMAALLQFILPLN